MTDRSVLYSADPGLSNGAGDALGAPAGANVDNAGL